MQNKNKFTKKYVHHTFVCDETNLLMEKLNSDDMNCDKKKKM